MQLKKAIATKREKISALLGREGIGFNVVNKALRKKDVKVNGKRVSEDLVVSVGDEIAVYYQEAEFSPTVVYSDENILICDKEQGIESIAYYEKIKSVYPTAIFTHRLDLNTGGLIVFALNEQAYEQLYTAFKKRTLDKIYLAEVYGFPEKDADRLVAYAKKDCVNGFVKVYPKKVKDSVEMITEYKVLKYGEQTSILQVKLITGKTHQIRCHLASVGHFIVGDGKYGKETINRMLGVKRQRLYSYSITFHFDSGSKLAYLNNKTFKIQNPFD